MGSSTLAVGPTVKGISHKTTSVQYNAMYNRLIEPREDYKPEFTGGYLWNFMQPALLRTLIDQAAEAIRGYDYDAVAFTGMSGALIGPGIAMRSGKTFIMVRKEGQSEHTSRLVEGDMAARRYIIVDDFIASGGTYARTRQAITLAMPQAECLGLLPVKEVDRKKLYPGHNGRYPLEPFLERYEQHA